MQVTYICHSGFLVETAECYYLFDYYKGSLPPLDVEKPVLVFVSHFHGDHFNPEIFSLLRAMSMRHITAVLAKDISQRKYPEYLAPANLDEQNVLDNPCGRGLIPVIKVHHSREYELPCRTHLQTLLSTDSGVAFYLTCPEGSLYHAGDLNDWNGEDTPEQERRQMTGSYRASLSDLRGKKIDIAFLPLDPRLGKCYADGFLYFLQTMHPGQVYPMHYWEKPEIIQQFLNEHPEYADLVEDTETAR